MKAVPSPQPHHEAGDGDKWLDRFFDAYYARRPVNATFIGIHTHDDRLPDLSDSAVSETCQEMQALLDTLDAIEALGVRESPHDSAVIDVALARNFLEIQLEEFELGWLHRRNPTVYTSEAIFGVIGLFLRDFQPFEARAKNAIARLQAIPNFLAQGKANLERAPRAWVEKAIKECSGAVAFLTKGIDDIIRHSNDSAPTASLTERSESSRAPLHASVESALGAFRDFERFLREEMLQRDDPNFACGTAFFNMLMRKGHHFDQDGETIAGYGMKRLRELQVRLHADARMFCENGDWRAALALTAEDHPTLENYPRVLDDEWRKCKAVSDEHGLVTWPSDWPLRYTPMPARFREAAPNLYFLPYRSPAPFDEFDVYDYWVPYIDPQASEAERTAKLRATNMSVVKLNHVVHHGAIGHHIQNWNARRAASRIGQIAATDCALRIAMFCGGSMAEGWACYATDVMDEVGFYTPLERFAQLHSQVRQAARCAADAALHLGAMTFDEAVDFYVREAGMTTDAAHGEVVKNSMFPGAAVMYLVGTDRIHALRGAMQARQGSAFNLRNFHDTFLSYGSLPVSIVAKMMLNTSEEAAMN